MKAIWRVISPLVLVVAFAVPVYAFVVASKAPGLPPRQEPPLVNLAHVPVVDIPSYYTVAPMLVYHDIAPAPSRYSVSPQAFAYQMAALRRAGFNAISAPQMLDFLHEHQALADRPIAIAFDDGLGSEWRVADPILARYHMRAIVFMANHRKEHGYYYLHPTEVQAMIKSGRWDIENHNDVKQYYRRNLVYRVRVYRSTHAYPLLKFLHSLTPIPVGLGHIPSIWVTLGKRHRLTHAVKGVVTLRPRVKHWLQVFWAPRRTAHWQDYRVNIRISNLGAEGSGTSGTLILAKYAVTLSAGRITVVGRHRWKGVITEAPAHKLSVTMTRNNLRVEVDGQLVDNARIPYTFGGISFGAWRSNVHALYPAFSELSVTPN